MLPAVLIALAAATPASPCMSFTEDQLSLTLEEVEEKITRLVSGSDEARADIAAEPWPHFSAWRRPIAAEDRGRLLEQVERMRSWLKGEQDELLAHTVLDTVSTIDLVELAPLFVDALGHPAPEIRKVAVQRFVRYPDARAHEALRRLASREPRERIRVELALALAALGDAADARAWRAWAEGDRPTCREAGLRALNRVQDDFALSAALELARSADGQQASLGAALLASRTDDEEAVEALLALADRPGEAGALAVGALVRMDDDRADDRLFELAASDVDRRRELVFSAIMNETNPLLAERLRRLGGLPSYYLRALDRMGAWPFDGPGAVTDPIVRAEPSGLEPVKRDPRFDMPWFVRGDSVDPDVRCAADPQEGDRVGVRPRVPVGSLLDPPLEVFELNGVERIRATVAGSDAPCIFSRSAIDPAPPEGHPLPAAALRTYDVPLSLLLVDRVRQLEVENAFTVQEMDSELATIRLSDELDDEDCADLARELTRLAWRQTLR